MTALSAVNEEKSVTCIVCPRGCRIKVSIKGGEIIRISGNLCKRGADYARSEVTQPMRVLTTTMRLEDGHLLPVKTARPIPKELLFEAVRELSGVRVKGPIEIGQVVYSNVAGTGVDVVATRSWN